MIQAAILAEMPTAQLVVKKTLSESCCPTMVSTSMPYPPSILGPGVDGSESPIHTQCW